MFGDADDFAILIDDLHGCDSLAGFFINRNDFIVAGYRVAKIDGSCKTYMVVAIRRDRTFIVVRLMNEG